MSSTPQPQSIDDLPPLERGGEEARKGFEFQDHVAAGFLIDMLLKPDLLEVWCETHDDITLIWRGNDGHEVEFVQVKALSLNQLWSVAKLTERERKDKKSVSGSSILERSMANDRGCEPSRFRIVTTLPPKDNLAFLQLPFNSPDRLEKSNEVSELVADLEKRIDNYRSPNGNGVEYWLTNSLWDVQQSDESAANSNKLELQRFASTMSVHLFPDQLDELYSALLAKERDAAVASWGIDPAKKKISKATLTEWAHAHLEAQRYLPPIAGTSLQGKLEKAGISEGDISACLESRHRYLTERYSPKYLTFKDLHYMEGEVAAVLHSMRANLDAGIIADYGVAFHAKCLTAVEQLQSKLPGTPPPLSVLQGCMYNIADRCVHRFRRATA